MKKLLLILSILSIPSIALASDNSAAMIEMVKAGANPIAAHCAVSGYDNITAEACEYAAKTPVNPPFNAQAIQTLQDEINSLNQKLDMLLNRQQ